MILMPLALSSERKILGTWRLRTIILLHTTPWYTMSITTLVTGAPSGWVRPNPSTFRNGFSNPSFFGQFNWLVILVLKLDNVCVRFRQFPSFKKFSNLSIKNSDGVRNSCDQKCSLTLAIKWFDFIQPFKMPDLKFKIVHRLESTTLYIWWYALVLA